VAWCLQDRSCLETYSSQPALKDGEWRPTLLALWLALGCASRWHRDMNAASRVKSEELAKRMTDFSKRSLQADDAVRVEGDLHDCCLGSQRLLHLTGHELDCGRNRPDDSAEAAGSPSLAEVGLRPGHCPHCGARDGWTPRQRREVVFTGKRRHIITDRGLVNITAKRPNRLTDRRPVPSAPRRCPPSDLPRRKASRPDEPSPSK
jgi:hypothetical protein